MRLIIFLLTLHGVCSAQFTNYSWITGGSYGTNGYDLLAEQINLLRMPGDTAELAVEKFMQAKYYGVGLFVSPTHGFEAFVASISDTAGYPLFYTTGCDLRDRNHNIVPGTERFASPFDTACAYVNYRYSYDDAYFLPMNDTTIDLIRPSLVWSYANYTDRTRIIYNKKTGTYRISLLMDTLLHDTGYGYEMTFIKHGNGKDWWLITQRGFGTGDGIFADSVYTFTVAHLSLNGVEAVFTYKFKEVEIGGRHVSLLVASPDGTKLLVSEWHEIWTETKIYDYQNLTLYDFDRCSGFLSKRTTWLIDTLYYPIPNIPAFSANSKWAYVATLVRQDIRRYNTDLPAEQIKASEEILGYCEPIIYQPLPGNDEVLPIFARISHLALARNGVIYGTGSFNWATYLHAIRDADSDTTPEFETNALYVGHPVGYFLTPRLNYELGCADGCTCLIEPPAIEPQAVALCPNPTDGQTIVGLNTGLIKNWWLYNAIGQLVGEAAAPVNQQQTTVLLGDIPKGVYYLTVHTVEGAVLQAPIVKTGQ